MTRRSGDTGKGPPGGRAAERLREFIDQRFPGASPKKEGEDALGRRAAEGEEYHRPDTDREEDQTRQ